MPTKIIQQKIKAYRHLISKSNLFAILQLLFHRSDVQRSIILTIQDRLYLTGKDKYEKQLTTDATFRRLNQNKFYSDFTVFLKKQSFARTQNVTLFNEGNFYKSFDSKTSANEFSLTADFKKIYDNFERTYTSKEKFENAILGMTDVERWAFLSVELLPLILFELKTEMNRI